MFLGACRAVQTLPPFVEHSFPKWSKLMRLCTDVVKGAYRILNARAQWMVQNPNHDV